MGRCSKSALNGCVPQKQKVTSDVGTSDVGTSDVGVKTQKDLLRDLRALPAEQFESLSAEELFEGYIYGGDLEGEITTTSDVGVQTTMQGVHKQQAAFDASHEMILQHFMQEHLDVASQIHTQGELLISIAQSAVAENDTSLVNAKNGTMDRVRHLLRCPDPIVSHCLSRPL